MAALASISAIFYHRTGKIVFGSKKSVLTNPAHKSQKQKGAKIPQKIHQPFDKMTQIVFFETVERVKNHILRETGPHQRFIHEVMSTLDKMQESTPEVDAAIVHLFETLKSRTPVKKT